MARDTPNAEDKRHHRRLEREQRRQTRTMKQTARLIDAHIQRTRAELERRRAGTGAPAQQPPIDKHEGDA